MSSLTGIEMVHRFSCRVIGLVPLGEHHITTVKNFPRALARLILFPACLVHIHSLMFQLLGISLERFLDPSSGKKGFIVLFQGLTLTSSQRRYINCTLTRNGCGPVR